MSDTELTRRQALTIAAATCCSCALASAQDDGTAEKSAKPAEKRKLVPLGKLEDYPDEAFYGNFAKSDRIFVRRLDDRLVAMSAICTHKRCTLKQDDADTLRCPCHKSLFTPYGTPTGGPAKVALPRYALTQAADGSITADLTQSFAEKEWDKPQAMIAIKK